MVSPYTSPAPPSGCCDTLERPGCRMPIVSCFGSGSSQEDVEAAGNCDACEASFTAAQQDMSSMLEGVTDIASSRATAAMASQPDLWESASEAAPNAASADDAQPAVTMRCGVFDDGPAEMPAPASVTPEPKPRRRKAPATAGRSSGAASPTQARSRSPPPGFAAPSKKVQDLITKTNDVFSKHRETYSDESMWANKIRKRTLDAATKSLSTLASQLLLCNHPEAGDLSTSVANWCDAAERRHQSLASVRSGPLEYVEEIGVEKLEPLRQLAVPMLSNIILHVAGECLKLLEKARSRHDTCKIFRAWFGGDMTFMALALALPLAVRRYQFRRMERRRMRPPSSSDWPAAPARTRSTLGFFTWRRRGSTEPELEWVSRLPTCQQAWHPICRVSSWRSGMTKS